MHKTIIFKKALYDPFKKLIIDHLNEPKDKVLCKSSPACVSEKQQKAENMNKIWHESVRRETSIFTCRVAHMH